ncbi:hypothetical protein LTR78_000974 [Recurvomyces mirabilis]|uniref:Pullulan synthetase n=1 Tax=Recurvomyces mirabilis TaxID=574656 RepID=A0AAE0WWW4_9PEZI|nr:hypothetical protein LTR78_000974 [Recurvomyces mirabilis]KAK5158946.1 hypothetical protein LTS14_003054 [Recurvomyces mirabilis]
MYTTTILTTLLATLAAASPYPRQTPVQTNFLLVATSQCPSTSNSSALADVSATSLFDPFNQKNYLLRLIAPGYGSLPRFNLTNGDLQSVAPGIEGVGVYEYNSTGGVAEGDELMFSPSAEPAGNLALKNGYLLTVDGEEEGWTICDGQLEESVIYWKGNDSSCELTYIHAVQDAPY